MNDDNRGDDPTNVISFARRTGQTGFTLTPTTTMDPIIPPPANCPPNTPSPAARTGRRSPLDALNALPDPGLTRPLIPATAPAPGGQPGHVPATFRNEGDDGMAGTPGLGALSMAATLAVAIAALRGTHTVLSTWWENRQARHAETAQLREARVKHALAMQQAGHSAEQAGAKHQAAMAGIRDKGAQQRAKTNRVPSSAEFGRKTAGNRNTSANNGPGRKPASGTGAGAKGPAGRGGAGGPQSANMRKNGPGKDAPKTNRGPLGRGNQTNGALDKKKLPDTVKKKLPGADKHHPKAPHRGSQGAGGGHGLKKHDTKNGPAQTGRTGLGAAVKKDTHDKAARRLEQRRKNGMDKPALWGSGKKQNRQQPVNLNKGQNNGNGKGAGKKQNQAAGPGPRNVNGAGRQAPGANTPQTPGGRQQRVKLHQAAWRQWRHAAARRWQHRGGQAPPVWGTPRQPKPVNLNKKPKNAGNTPRGAAGGGGQAGRQQQRKQKNRQWWAKARAYARKKAAGGGCFPGATPGQGAAGAGPAGANNPGPGPGGAYVPPRGNGQRHSPFAAAGQAAGATYTVTSDHIPGSQAKRWEPDAVTTGTPALPSTGPAALDAAPVETFPRPSTTRPKEPIAMPPAPVPAHRPDPRITKAKKQAHRAAVNTVGRQMHQQHETEITLDDACDAAEDLTGRGFKAHDQSNKLSRQAEQLHNAWLNLAERCANDNNLIGDLFTMAALKFAESVELTDRMAQEMAVSSLQAAEKAETAGNEINDAYRPYNVATADAGLTTPSAPVHNEA